jgi:hypothetical protein
MKEQDKEIYLMAAEKIALGENNYACCAISGAASEIKGGEYNPEHPLRKKFEEYFYPGFDNIVNNIDCGWFGYFTEKNQVARSLALLSMLYCGE